MQGHFVTDWTVAKADCDALDMWRNKTITTETAMMIIEGDNPGVQFEDDIEFSKWANSLGYYRSF